jgi:hypothetical protein
MSSHSYSHDEEEWLDVGNIDVTESSDVAPSVLSIRPAPFTAISLGPVPNSGMQNGGFSTTIMSVGSLVEALPLYQSMQESAKKLQKSEASIFHATLGNDYHVIRDAFNSGLPTGHLQKFNCTACHRFMKKFGDLVMVDAASGSLIPLFWNADLHNDFYKRSVKAVQDLFQGKKMRKAFRVNMTVDAGTFEAGGFLHMNYKFPAQRVRVAEPKGFASATVVELAQMLDRILEDNQVSTIQKAADLLLEDKLPYADKHKGAIRWLRDLVEKGQLAKVSDDANRHNLLYLAAADSFLGCIHQLRSGALSTLLKGLGEGLPFPTIKDSWASLSGPIAYMRPTAAPSSRKIAAAEKLFSDLNLSKDDLKRKYLLMKDLPQEVIMWSSPTAPQHPSGIFSSLTPKSKPSPQSNLDDPSIPPTSLTFASFVNRILPTATSIECHLQDRLFLDFMITGLPGTNPLMQWHTPTNLASSYVYTHPQPPESHNLKPGWTKVTAIIPFPSLWEGIPSTITFPLPDELTQSVAVNDGTPNHKAYKHAHHGWGYLLCLENIEDRSSDSCLFPTYLRSELHGVRSTIAAYSREHGIERVDGEGPMVGGVSVSIRRAEMELLLRVRDQRGRLGRYKITLFQ